MRLIILISFLLVYRVSSFKTTSQSYRTSFASFALLPRKSPTGSNSRIKLIVCTVD